MTPWTLSSSTLTSHCCIQMRHRFPSQTCSSPRTQTSHSWTGRRTLSPDRLSKTFTDPALLWLVPDFLNDFQLQVARRNINARFAKAEPLPRSVAAVFDQIDHAKIKSDGFQVVVVDQTGGTTYATKLIARHDADLLERVPRDAWLLLGTLPSRHASARRAGYDALVEIPRVDKDGHWNDQSVGDWASTGFRGSPPPPSPDRSSSTSASRP